MRFVIFLTTVFVFLNRPSLASFDTKKGARPLAMGGAYTAAAFGGDAFYYNPAGLWYNANPMGQAFFSRPFNLTELQTVTFNFTYPYFFGNVSANAESYGYDLYRETTLSLAYANVYKERVAMGVVINYNHLAIKNAGSAAAVGLDFGILVRPLRMLTVGAMVRNINHPSIKKDVLPQAFTVGACFQIMDHFRLMADAYKDVRYPTDIRVGGEYTFMEKFIIRSGLGSDPSRFCGGFGLDLGLAVLDYGFNTHQELGMTHALSLSFHIDRKPSRSLQPSLR